MLPGIKQHMRYFLVNALPFLLQKRTGSLLGNQIEATNIASCLAMCHDVHCTDDGLLIALSFSFFFKEYIEKRKNIEPFSPVFPSSCHFSFVKVSIFVNTMWYTTRIVLAIQIMGYTTLVVLHDME